MLSFIPIVPSWHTSRGGQNFSHAEGGGGGHKRFWGSFYAVA